MLDVIHGANPEQLYRAFGLPMPEEVIDFSTNTNALSWPDINIDVRELASSYPDPECSALRELVSSRENVSPSRILFTSGTNEAIFLLSQVITGSTAILQPAYSEYFRAFRELSGCSGLAEALKHQNIIVVNPSNPTGKYIHLSQTINNHPDNLFIIDEAYRDFLLWETPERLCSFPNVILLRSLTKIYHLSGARIGYVIAPEHIIARLRERQPSWSVNGIAQALALQFMRDKDFISRTRDFYRRNTPAFIEGLRRAGCEVMSSDVHFFLVRVNDDEKVIRHLLKRGIVVRHTRNFAGLGGKYIRAATMRPEDNKKLIAAMKDIV